MSKSILKNLSYNVILQIVLMIVPLISIPYVSRVLGAEGIGTYSFTLSVTQYFIILGTMGIALYGNRQIAYVRDDSVALSRTFWSIFILRVLSTTIALFAYYVLFSFEKSYQLIRMIQSIHIISAMFDITWLFVGLEDFKRIVTRNLFIKILGVIAVFVFVNDVNDVMMYTLINVGMSLASSLIMWLYVPKIIKRVKLSLQDVRHHFIPVLRLFVPQIASQVYVLLDKTMLGYLANVEQVGFYTQAERIVKSVLEVITALGVVMLPRMSNIFAKGEFSKMQQYLNTSLIGVSYVAVPMVLGIIGVTGSFVPWFFGLGFEPVTLLMMTLSPILLFITISSVLGVQFLLPSNRVNEFTISIVSGALMNLTLNSILITRYGALGAVIGTLGAELSVMSIQFYFLRKLIDFKRFLSGFLKFIVSGIVMMLITMFIGSILIANATTTMLQVASGIIVYFLILYLLKEETNSQALGILRSVFGKLILRIQKSH